MQNLSKGTNGLTRLLTAIIVAALITSLVPVPAKAAVTSAKTPQGVAKAHIKWQKRFGTGYANAVTPPLLVGSHMYIGSGGYMYKLNKNTGKVLQKLKVEGVFGYTTIAPAYNGADKIFVPLSEGRIEAIDIGEGKMKKLWTSKSFGGQAISPIICKGDSLYTGAFGKGGDSYFVKIDQDTGSVTRLAVNENGYYWVGAYVTDKFVVFGEEAGTDGKARVKVVRTDEGELPEPMSEITVTGSVRSGIVADSGNLYFVTKGKRLYKTSLDSETGKLAAPKNVTLTGESTGVPLVYKGRAYVGTSAGKIDVIDVGTMKRKYSVATPGYVQGEMLLSNSGGKLKLYAAYNSPVGGIYYIEPGSTKATVKGNLIVPDNKQYCISPVICDSEGTLFYKNDSGYIMAITKGYFSGKVKLTAKAGKKKAILRWKKVSGAEGYMVYRGTKKKGKYKKIATVVKVAANIKYTNTKLKAGKKYYYKVKAYRATTGSKKVYTKFSNIKTIKAKRK
ncbi:MAG: PQQ-binding-like beta-propeller repeat protein [Firmicutes bacterium]|nr:PQQ-binding-like beta-propeller repeat protein [Bacillota bacterium]